MDRWLPEAEHILFYHVQKVLNRYARGVDRQDWELMISAFHDDAIDDHGSHIGGARQFAEFMKVRQGGVSHMMHVNANINILAVDHQAREVMTETYCVGWQRLASDAKWIPPLFKSAELGDELTAPRLLAVGNRYLDLVTEHDGDLRIYRRKVIYEWLSLSVGSEQEQLAPFAQAQRSMADASFTTIEAFRRSFVGGVARESL